MFTKIITSEVLVAYSKCPRSAFLSLCSEEHGVIHEYVQTLEEHARQNRNAFIDRVENEHPGASSNDRGDIISGKNVLVKIRLTHQDLAAECEMLTKVSGASSLGDHCYEPTIVVGTRQITKDQKLALLFVGYLLGRLQNQLPENGTIVGMDGKAHKVKMESADHTIIPIIKALREWKGRSPSAPPPLLLNKHCQLCQFRKICLEQAEKDDDLSLLSHMTPKKIMQYHKKGIFTVTQLSYLFKPRRSRKRHNTAPITFNLELQALALRTKKIYIKEVPAIIRRNPELFLDIEGVPDQEFHYLIGLLISENETRSYHYFWANTKEEENQTWSNFLKKIDEYPDAPIYHYGSYEPRAVEGLARRYRTVSETLKKRLVNLTTSIYGNVYFPTRSNNLKDLGRVVGASWTAPDASGLQSLVWRHRWEETGESQHREMLITYNREDCEALRCLLDELSRIVAGANEHKHVEFADETKQHATELGNEVHEEFQDILKFAHADYDKKRLKIRSKQRIKKAEPKKIGAPKGHQGYQRLLPSKANFVIHVAPLKTCPKHVNESLQISKKTAEKLLIDLRFSRTGCRKTVTRYVGAKSYCPECGRHYLPPIIEELGSNLFGHAFQAWVVYARIVLRLPYRIILDEMEELFHERVSASTTINFIKNFASYYAASEKFSIQRILDSPFVHADETLINVQGVDHYAWVFTDGNHVVFRMTETREATIVHEFLTGYKGILISDFYAGYDAVPCRQQKCLVHLIRDLNNDLWSDPYNQLFENFTLEVKKLIVPIFEAEGKHGLKTRHLRKFRKSVDQFYRINIDFADSICELVAKYQKRFRRYRDSLFTFLEFDSIPWHNNTAENAIRQLAVQRKISGTFFKDVAPKYLLLLGIAQTCRFQDKSLLKFFLSEEIDVDKFKAARRITISSPVVR